MRRILAGLFLLATLSIAEEGKWTPQQVLELDPAWLKSMGLQLPVSRLWDPQRGTGMLAAAVNTGGCSGGFVSPDGLVLSNHHCFFGIVQEHSRPGRDLITDGFLAKSQADELPSKTMRITVPRKFTDVTKDIVAAGATAKSDLDRTRMIEEREKEFVTQCEKPGGLRCQVATFDGGLAYTLVEALDLTDIRLVYAPPRAIGEFGGEPDNFRWPRHVGDFAIARAYKDGKPYRPEFYFPLSNEGVKPGDFVMVLGYPGRTFRAMTSSEMENEHDNFERRTNLYGEWIKLLELTSEGNAAGKISIAATLKSLNNSNTNAQGQLAGLARGKIIAKQKIADDAVVAWAESRMPQAIAAKKELDRLAADAKRSAPRSYLLSTASSGSIALRDALTIVRLATQRPLSDAAREAAYQERNWKTLRNTLELSNQRYFAASDQALFVAWINRALRLDQQIQAVSKAFDLTKAKDLTAAMFKATRITDAAERMKMFEESVERLHARKDPLLEFAFAMDVELTAYQSDQRALAGAVARLRPEWRKAVIAHAGKPVAPDANSTLRVSFAHIEGYSPRDGVFNTPQSTLAGMLEKDTGEEPFAVPTLIREAAKRVDPRTVPLDFLSNADTTGGNSGSPVVNAKGEMVGLNFDRVWENVANDFGYNPEVARNISVDLRFLIWLLREQHGESLLAEMGVR